MSEKIVTGLSIWTYLSAFDKATQIVYHNMSRLYTEYAIKNYKNKCRQMLKFHYVLSALLTAQEKELEALRPLQSHRCQKANRAGYVD